MGLIPLWARITFWAPLVALMVKNLPAMRETKVCSLGQEDPLEEGMVTHSNILVWRIPWTEEPGRLQCIGLQKVRHNQSNLECTKARKTHRET